MTPAPQPLAPPVYRPNANQLVQPKASTGMALALRKPAPLFSGTIQRVWKTDLNPLDPLWTWEGGGAPDFCPRGGRVAAGEVEIAKCTEYYNPAEYKPAEHKPAEHKPAEHKPAGHKPAQNITYYHYSKAMDDIFKSEEVRGSTAAGKGGNEEVRKAIVKANKAYFRDRKAPSSGGVEPQGLHFFAVTKDRIKGATQRASNLDQCPVLIEFDFQDEATTQSWVRRGFHDYTYIDASREGFIPLPELKQFIKRIYYYYEEDLAKLTRYRIYIPLLVKIDPNDDVMWPEGLPKQRNVSLDQSTKCAVM